MSNKSYTTDKKGISGLTLRSDDIPKPGRGQVLIKIHASSLNARDLQSVKGEYQDPSPHDVFVPNSDASGEVVQVGEQVLNLKKGDRVYSVFFQSWQGGEFQRRYFESNLGGHLQGTLTHYRVLDEQGVIKIPPHLSFEEAACLTCAASTAWNALYEGARPLISGQTVLLIGTGGVSMAALQFAKGAIVIIISSSDEKLEKAKKLGADHGVNYKEFPEWEKKILELTDGRGVDVVVETGGPKTIIQSLKASSICGQIPLIGKLGKGKDTDVFIHVKGHTIRGIGVASYEMYEHMNRALEFHKIKPIIDKVFPFSQTKEAFEYLESQKHVGKVVIKMEH